MSRSYINEAFLTFHSDNLSCESEIRQCQRTDTGDSSYEDILAQWKQSCGKKITFSPTTPALATYTPYDSTILDLCTHIYLACASWSSQGASCSSQYTLSAEYQSCQCQTDVLAQASVCQVDGATCLGEAVVSSTLWSNMYCAGVLTTGTDSMATSMVSMIGTLYNQY